MIGDDTARGLLCASQSNGVFPPVLFTVSLKKKSATFYASPH